MPRLLNLVRRPIIGILGGVGPMAGIIFHQKIIDKCVVSRDQQHLDVVHLSLSQYVGDRTEYILDMESFYPFDVILRCLGNHYRFAFYMNTSPTTCTHIIHHHLHYLRIGTESDLSSQILPYSIQGDSICPFMILCKLRKYGS